LTTVDLPLLSAAFAAFAITLYVMLDGFDLGVGALLLVQPDEHLRDQMVDSILPTWDGNETWLVMTGVTLLAAFPIAYGIVMPALYLPVMVMLLALGLRGVSFEFRYQVAGKRRRFWDVAFSVGSIVAASMQGLIVGGLIQGVAVTGDHFSGSVSDTFQPLPLVAAATVLAGYVVLGSSWLHLKATARLRSFADRTVRLADPMFAGLATATGIAAAFVQPGVAAAWVAHSAFLILIAGFFFAASAGLMAAIGGRSDVLPFTLALVLVALAIAAIVRTIFPDIVPFRLTLWAAASSTLSQVFLLIGATIVTPVVLAYTAFAYRVFRGKTPEKGWEG
jgi:cytochrome d ubiquinol oxidase subunit II